VATIARTSEATAAAGSGDGSVTDQVVTVLAPLQTAADGTHQVTLELQPEGMGSVQATVQMGPQQMTISLWTDSAAGHATLTQSLSQLHSQLADGSGRQVNVQLANFGSSQPDAQNGSAQFSGGRGQSGRAGGSEDSDEAASVAASTTIDTTGTDRSIDIQL